MSNKSRLQTNNTNLQGLINKANALPDAGSGGGSGGASVETCSVSVKLSYANFTCYYVDASGELNSDSFDSAYYIGETSTHNFDVQKNGILIIQANIKPSIGGGCTHISSTTSIHCYYITDNAEINIINTPSGGGTDPT